MEPQGEGHKRAEAPRRQLHTCPSVPEKGELRRGDRYFQAGAFRAWLGTLCWGFRQLPTGSPRCAQTTHIRRMDLQPWLRAPPFTDLGKPAPLYLLIKLLACCFLCYQRRAPQLTKLSCQSLTITRRVANLDQMLILYQPRAKQALVMH